VAGYAYIHLGMNEEARAAFQLAMKYDPENAAWRKTHTRRQGGPASTETA